MSDRTWRIIDHLCRRCGGRVLECASGVITGGGNPLYHCADCGASNSGMGPAVLCWCGFQHRGQAGPPEYLCLPFSVIQEQPWMREAFAHTGCFEDGKAEVGVTTQASMRICRERWEALPPPAGEPGETTNG